MAQIAYNQDDCKSASDVWAKAQAVRERRMAMFARPVLVEPEPEPKEPEPIEVPAFLPRIRWTGFYWVGDFNLLVREAYPSQIEMPRPSIHAIIHAVSVAAGVRSADIVAERRTANVIMPRHVAMALCKRLTLRSLPAIGAAFGGRDHTTVLHACRKMELVIAEASFALPPDADVSVWARKAIELCAIIRPKGFRGCRSAPESQPCA